jgi:hypothetical protein
MTAPSAAGTGAQAAPVLATGLFDDAALFPPGDAPMAAAVPAHRDLRERLGDLVGPFVVPAARLGELSAHLGDGEPIDVSLIAATGDLPAAAARVGAHPGLTLAAVEVPVATDVAAAREAVRVLDDVPARGRAGGGRAAPQRRPGRGARRPGRHPVSRQAAHRRGARRAVPPS